MGTKTNKYFYHLSLNKKIGERSDAIQGAILNKKLLIFGNFIKIQSKEKKKNIKIGYGVMNYNGLYIIPPVFKSVDYNGFKGFFKLKGFYNKDFRVDLKGKCIENCDTYNKIIKGYSIYLNTKG